MRTSEGRTLLSAAVASKKVAMVKLVLDRGLGFTEPKESGPYDACLGAKFEIIELLLHHPSVPLGKLACHLCGPPPCVYVQPSIHLFIHSYIHLCIHSFTPLLIYFYSFINSYIYA